jgi:hypothetical protein
MWALAAVCGLVASVCSVTVGSAAAREVLELNVQQDPKWHGGEPEIAINPKDPNNLVMVWPVMKVTSTPAGQYPSAASQFASAATGNGSTSCQMAYSFDRGITWYPTRFPFADTPGCGDAMVAAGPAGDFYVAFDALGDWKSANVENGLPNQHCAVARSVDGGRSFTEATDTGTIVDRPFFRVDPSTGWVYLASGGFVPPEPRDLAVSRDHAKTWSVPATFPGSHLAVNRGLVATAKQAGAMGSPAQLTFSLSRDNGATYTTVNVSGATGGSGDYVSADPTRANHFAVMQTAGNTLQVFTTKDAGTTWAGPVKVTNDAARAVTKPWMDYGSNGALAVMWKSTTADGAGFEVFVAVSKDGGHTFGGPAVKISAAPSKFAPPEYLAGDDLSWVSLDDTYAFLG